MFVTNIKKYQISYLNIDVFDGDEVYMVSPCIFELEWSHTKDEEKKEYIANEKSDIVLIDPINPQPIKINGKYNKSYRGI